MELEQSTQKRTNTPGKNGKTDKFNKIIISSEKLKGELVNKINLEALALMPELMNSTPDTVVGGVVQVKYAEIKISQTLHVSFWDNQTKGTLGLLIKSESIKWGWNYSADNGTWSPCRYMDGTTFGNVVFGKETNQFITDFLIDVGKTNETVKKTFNLNK